MISYDSQNLIYYLIIVYCGHEAAGEGRGSEDGLNLFRH